MALNVGIVIQAIDRATAPIRHVTDNFAKLRQSVEKAKGAFAAAANMEHAASAVARFAGQARSAVEGPMRLAVEFEKAMAVVASKTSASADELARLTDTARGLGKSTAFSSMQVAEAMQSLGQAGFDTNKIVSAMPGLLDLSAASGTGLADAASMAADTLNAFGLEASESMRVADVLTVGANKANTSLSELGMGLSYVSANAQSVGQSLETTVAMLGTLADRGIKGTRGGTALTAMLARLQGPSGEAAKVLKRFGVAARDTDGNARPLIDVLTDLAKATENVGSAQRGAALKDLFGLEAMAAGTILMENLEVVLEKTQQGLNSAGEAARMASRNMDNAAGDLEEMSGSMEDLGISIGNVALPAVRTFARTIGSVADTLNTWASAHPGVTKALVLTLAGVAVVGTALTGLIVTLAAATTAAGVFGVAMGVQGTGAQILGHALGVARIRVLAMATANGAATFSFGRLTVAMLSTAARGVGSFVASLGRMVVTTVAAAIPAIWSAVTAFGAFGAAIMATPVGWVAAAIAAIAGGAYLIYRNWDTLVAWWEGLSPRWRAVFTLLFLPIVGFIRLIRLIRDNWGEIAAFFVAAGRRIWQGMRWLWASDPTLQRFRAMAGLIKLAWSPLQEFFVELWNGIKEAFTGALEWIEKKMKGVGDKAIAIVQFLGLDETSGPSGAPKPRAPDRPTVAGGATEVGGTLDIKLSAAPGTQAAVGGLERRGPMDLSVDMGWSMVGAG